MSKRPATNPIVMEEAKKRRLEKENESNGQIEAVNHQPEEKLVDENFQHPEELSLLENLTRCGNVIENIIEYLPKKDILSLTLASKTINSFISDNPKILEKFTMNIPHIGEGNKENYNFKDIRRYPKWELKYGIHMKYLGFVAELMQRYGPHVKSLKVEASERMQNFTVPVFVNTYVTKTSLIKVLSCCQNLQHLEISFGRRPKAMPVNLNKTLDLPQLTSLVLHCGFIYSCALLPLFTTCKLRTLEWLGNLEYLANSVDKLKSIKEFLKGQNKLENLKMSFYPLELFSDDEMTTVGFKLKSLSFEHHHPGLMENENFAKFFNLHKLSLTELALHYIQDLKFLEGFSNIKTLTIDHFSTTNLNLVLSSVEKLTILNNFHRFDTLKDFEASFPNVKEVEIKNAKIDRDFPSNLPKIEGVKLKNCEITANLTFSNLKVLHLERVTINVVDFIWDSNQLKVLVVKEGTNNARFIEQLLMHEDTNLNFLKLVGRNYLEAYSPALHQVINQNRHKIKMLTIVERESG